MVNMGKANQSILLMLIGDVLRLQDALGKVYARCFPLQLQEHRPCCRRAVDKTALERVESSQMIAVDMAEEACERRVVHDVSEVIDWVRVRESTDARESEDAYP